MLAGSLCTPAVLAAQTSHTMPARASSAIADSAAVSSLLTSPLGSRGPSGFAVLSGRTLRVEWTGDRAGSARPWSIRRGSCARDEGELHASAALAPLTVDASGKASAIAELEAPMPPGKAYLVVHNSTADPEPVVLACGSLSNGAAPEDMEGAMDHSAMDHSTMDHSTTAMGTPPANGEHAHADTSGMETAGTTHDQRSSGLMAIYARMMADLVIRERVRTDPVLQRMIDDLDVDSAKMPIIDAIVMPKTPTAKSSAKKAPASKPAVKKAPKPIPAMPGMDHSKMPGMKKPPA